MHSKSKNVLSFALLAFISSFTTNYVQAIELNSKPASPETPPEQRMVQKAYKNIKQGDYDSAIPLLKKAVEIDPSNEDAHRYLAYSYLKKGLVTLSLTESKSLVEGGSRLPHDHFALGEANFYNSKFKEALRNYKDALVLDPKFTDARMGVIRSLLAMNKTQEAKTICEDAAYNSPTIQSKGQFKKLLNEINSRSQIASTIRYGS